MRILPAFGLVLGVLSCQREPVDPIRLRAEAGKRSFDFCYALNHEQYDKATLFFSRNLRKNYPNPASHPIIVERQNGTYDQVLPTDQVVVDYKRKRVFIEVRYKKVIFPHPGAPPIWRDVKRVYHEWIWENGQWYFNGERLSPS